MFEASEVVTDGDVVVKVNDLLECVPLIGNAASTVVGWSVTLNSFGHRVD